ncbi:MAG: response regulator [Brevundimonas sp.]|uniref:response regulator transcription factor n=1 Tax=Brevundimonas sp. TaxID=1871086 RepID=UPI00248923D2|nr:response regulator [Brevundimonas sp.]MDI1325302.1 response regulator [Brevundimonas sp.]
MPAKILIVDDHEAIRTIIDSILTHAGHSCMTAATGETALQMARRFRFDLAILDVNMPHMSGLEVLSRIRRFVPLVVMVTANSSVDTVREAVALGCDGYVAKPIEVGVLLARVQRVLARQRIEI